MGDADAFLTDIFGRTAHHRVGADVDDLLSLADVDRLLTGGGLRRPSVRLVRDGRVLPPASWTRRVRTGAVTVDDLVDVGRLLELHHDGATIVLQSMQRWWPPLERFCRELEVRLGHAVQANAYLTPAGAVGLAPHHDTHDVFVLQTHGTKHWTVRAPLVEVPLPRHQSDPATSAAQPVLFDAELAPGDCLYLPRGVIHSARSQRDVSLHVTIGVLATTLHDVVRRLTAIASDAAELRRPLPTGWATDPDVGARAVADAVEALVTHLRSLDPAVVAGDLAERYRRGRPTPLDGQLLELVALEAVDDTAVVIRRDGLVVASVCVDDRVRLHVGRRVVDLPAALVPALDRLLDGTPRRVDELADLLDESSRLVLVRRLIRDGVLQRSERDG